MLRKRRVNDFDLSDSEDEAEARQRAKRRARAKLRKALLEDANLGKIGEYLEVSISIHFNVVQRVILRNWHSSLQ